MSKQPKDFDWDLVEGKGFGGSYTAELKEQMEAAIEATLNSVTEKEVVKGIVVSKTDREVIINIGFKSDGLVSASEFRDMPDLKAGDEVEVYIENQEDANGQLTLSRKLAKVMGAWTNIERALEEDTIINGFVKRRTKGGLIVDIFGIEAFLPGSQIDVKPIRDFDIFVGKNMEVKVVKINHTNDKRIVGACLHCGAPTETYLNCANLLCNRQHLVCEECETQFQQCCSVECMDVASTQSA